MHADTMEVGKLIVHLYVYCFNAIEASGRAAWFLTSIHDSKPILRMPIVTLASQMMSQIGKC